MRQDHTAFAVTAVGFLDATTDVSGFGEFGLGVRLPYGKQPTKLGRSPGRTEVLVPRAILLRFEYRRKSGSMARIHLNKPFHADFPDSYFASAGQSTYWRTHGQPTTGSGVPLDLPLSELDALPGKAGTRAKTCLSQAFGDVRVYGHQGLFVGDLQLRSLLEISHNAIGFGPRTENALIDGLRRAGVTLRSDTQPPVLPDNFPLVRAFPKQHRFKDLVFFTAVKLAADRRDLGKVKVGELRALTTSQLEQIARDADDLQPQQHPTNLLSSPRNLSNAVMTFAQYGFALEGIERPVADEIDDLVRPEIGAPADRFSAKVDLEYRLGPELYLG